MFGFTNDDLITMDKIPIFQGLLQIKLNDNRHLIDAEYKSLAQRRKAARFEWTQMKGHTEINQESTFSLVFVVVPFFIFVVVVAVDMIEIADSNQRIVRCSDASMHGSVFKNQTMPMFEGLAIHPVLDIVHFIRCLAIRGGVYKSEQRNIGNHVRQFTNETQYQKNI